MPNRQKKYIKPNADGEGGYWIMAEDLWDAVKLWAKDNGKEYRTGHVVGVGST